MEKVLITGAYGLLGSYTVREMKENGYYVRAFGRNPEKLQALKDDHVELFVGDFCNPDDIDKAAEGMDYVIHVGAKLGWGKREDFFKTNVEGTRNVIEACARHHVKRLVFCSAPSLDPLKNNFHITEKDYNANNKLTYYIESKIAAEKLVREQTKVPFSIIRPRGVCGIGDTRMIPVLINANKTIGIPLFAKGKIVVELCCAANAALALRLCTEKDEALGQAYNITNDEPTLITELAEEMFTTLGVPSKFRRLPFYPMYAVAAVLEAVYKALKIYDKAPMVTRSDICMLGRNQIFDISKAKKELGYVPKESVSQMIQAYAADYKKNSRAVENQKVETRSDV